MLSPLSTPAQDSGNYMHNPRWPAEPRGSDGSTQRWPSPFPFLSCVLTLLHLRAPLKTLRCEEFHRPLLRARARYHCRRNHLSQAVLFTLSIARSISSRYAACRKAKPWSVAPRRRVIAFESILITSSHKRAALSKHREPLDVSSGGDNYRTTSSGTVPSCCSSPMILSNARARQKIASGISFLPKLFADFHSPFLSLYLRSIVAFSTSRFRPFWVEISFSQSAHDMPPALNFATGCAILFTSGDHVFAWPLPQ